jgi:hypothetical protein
MAAGILKKAKSVPAWNLESIPTSSSAFLPQKAQFLFDESSTMDQTALIPQHHNLFKNGKTPSRSLC